MKDYFLFLLCQALVPTSPLSVLIITTLTMAPSGTIKLASGHEMPLVGFGLWKVPADQAAETVYNVSFMDERIIDFIYSYRIK